MSVSATATVTAGDAELGIVALAESFARLQELSLNHDYR